MKWLVTTSSDSPTTSASPASSVPNKVLATIGQRQVPHVLVQVADLAVAPRLEHALGVLDHHGGVPLDLLALKRRLGQPTLSPPKLSLAGQESLADQWNEPPCQFIFHEIVGVRSQHVIDVLRIDKNVRGQVAQP